MILLVEGVTEHGNMQREDLEDSEGAILGYMSMEGNTRRGGKVRWIVLGCPEEEFGLDPLGIVEQSSFKL